MGMLFTSKVYQWDIIFTQKVYEYVNVKNNMNRYHFRYSKYMNGSYFSLTLVYEKGGVLGLQPQDLTQIQGKVTPPPPRDSVHIYTKCAPG